MCGPPRHGLWHTPLFTHLSFHPNIVNLHVGSDLSTAAPVHGSTAILLHRGGGGGDRRSLPWVPLSLMWAFLFNTVFSRPICVPCWDWAKGLPFFSFFSFEFSHTRYMTRWFLLWGRRRGWSWWWGVEVFGENLNNHVVLGDHEHFARQRAPQMVHVKTFTPTAIEGNIMSCQRSGNPFRSVGSSRTLMKLMIVLVYKPYILILSVKMLPLLAAALFPTLTSACTLLMPE